MRLVDFQTFSKRLNALYYHNQIANHLFLQTNNFCLLNCAISHNQDYFQLCYIFCFHRNIKIHHLPSQNLLLQFSMPVPKKYHCIMNSDRRVMPNTQFRIGHSRQHIQTPYYLPQQSLSYCPANSYPRKYPLF